MKNYLYLALIATVVGLINYGVWQYDHIPTKVEPPSAPTQQTTPVKPPVVKKPVAQDTTDCPKWQHLVQVEGQDKAQAYADKYGLHARFAACGGKK